MRPSSRRADDVCLSLRERVLWISGGAVARSGQDRTLGHAALVGCGFGMVLSALKWFAISQRGRKPGERRGPTAARLSAAKREASIVYERSAAPALGCRPSREGESTAPPASGTKPGARKAGASPPARSVALPENADDPGSRALRRRAGRRRRTLSARIPAERTSRSAPPARYADGEVK